MLKMFQKVGSLRNTIKDYFNVIAFGSVALKFLKFRSSLQILCPILYQKITFSNKKIFVFPFFKVFA